MKSSQHVVAGAVVALLAIASYGIYWTGQERTPAPRSANSIASTDTTPAPDESALLTAQELVRLPTTASELPFARQALRTADQAMDLAFEDALREAALHPQPLSKQAQRIAARLQRAQQQKTADSTLVAQYSATATPTVSHDQFDLAKARLELDQEQVDDAKEDLIRAGGDLQGRLQAMMQEHRETSHSSDSTQIKVTARRDEGGLVQTAQSFSVLRRKDLQLQLASASAESASVKLAALHDKLDTDTTSRAGAASNVSRRSSNQKRLARTYSNWLEELRWQERDLANRALRGLVAILVIGLLLLFSDALVSRVLERFDMKRRSAQRLRVVARVALQALGILLILIIIFGTPNNLGTIIGLAGAGLTVALKDFIVSFVGWLVLMGKHGIRIGDLVEINSVTGEVVELGMFNTVLHETGNWTDSGHATGRRVTFTNSYAVEGHYFNFSTSGQWLWDEVRIDVPSGTDPYPVVEALQKHVEEATAESARLAEQEWNRALRSPGVETITAAPAITIKPVMGGVEVTLRYITHAAERYEVRSKLYRAAVEVLAEAHASPRETEEPASPHA
jgi:small-conductance mechanosensitive channel